MTLALILILTCMLLELLHYTPTFWQYGRRPLAVLLVIAISATSGLLLAQDVALGSCLFALVSCYRVFNEIRIVEGRMQPGYLRRITLRTSVVLLAFQLGILLLWAMANEVGFHSSFGWLGLGALQLLLSLWLTQTIQRNILRSKLQFPAWQTAERELPSISVCIPARNETVELESCLKALLASNYPKLEILVLDDQSHDRTPDIIRSFAHDGVRFIKGKQPSANWLAKNWAYQRLYEEASGDLLLFMGVDVRLGRQSLRMVASAMHSSTFDMLSFAPDNEAHYSSVLLQPMRYAWELCRSSLFSKRPAVLSTCWVADRDFIRKAGGFAAVQSAILPEAYFAAMAAQHYHFVYADATLAIHSQKDRRSQWDTAVRTRYPQLHRRPELVLAVSVLECSVLILPLPMLVGGLWTHNWWLALLSALTLVMLHYTFRKVSSFTYRQDLPRADIALLPATLLDLYVRHYSMWQYEFGEVIWKGRDVTAPVMHVIPRLPNLT